MARAYFPFSFNSVNRGSDKKCRICGVAKANQHSMAESAQCDWLRRPKAERERILAEAAAQAAGTSTEPPPYVEDALRNFAKNRRAA